MLQPATPEFETEFCLRFRLSFEQRHLRYSVNIYLHKAQGAQLTAGSVGENYKESVKKLLSNENAFHFMSSVKDTPAYWKQFLHEVLAMVKELRIATYFLTSSYTDLRNSLINKLSNLNLTDEKIWNLTYQQRTKLLNDIPVLVARHFQ